MNSDAILLQTRETQNCKFRMIQSANTAVLVLPPGDPLVCSLPRMYRSAVSDAAVAELWFIPYSIRKLYRFKYFLSIIYRCYPLALCKHTVRSILGLHAPAELSLAASSCSMRCPPAVLRLSYTFHVVKYPYSASFTWHSSGTPLSAAFRACLPAAPAGISPCSRRRS